MEKNELSDTEFGVAFGRTIVKNMGNAYGIPEELNPDLVYRVWWKNGDILNGLNPKIVKIDGGWTLSELYDEERALVEKINNLVSSGLNYEQLYKIYRFLLDM